MVSRWPKSPFWYRDLFFGIEILYSVVQHLYRPLLGINLSVLFWASTSCKVEVKEDLDTEKKIEKSRYLKKDISIPTKRVTHLGKNLEKTLRLEKGGPGIPRRVVPGVPGMSRPKTFSLGCFRAFLKGGGGRP